MSKGIFITPTPKNEPALDYAPGSKARKELQEMYNKMINEKIDIPMYIGDEMIYTDNKKEIRPPQEISKIIGTYNYGTKEHVHKAIDSALKAKEKWAALSWEQRAAIFLKAADLISGPYRSKLNASTMLAQSKNCYQSEVDAVCELADFLRFNVAYMRKIYTEQVDSMPGMWNKIEYRPLEGFVFAITPFNFTAIAGNLCATPAMLGNTVVWKPAESQVYSAQVIMEIYRDAGLPDGVINMIIVDGAEAGEIVFNHKDFAGLHFTGSTGVFKSLWKAIGNNIDKYRTYPRIVGETGGKDFIIAHKSADPKQVSTAISRGAFEFQGQKCSAASRVYLPNNISDKTIEYLIEDLKSIKMGSPQDFTNFVNAVIDERAFDKISSYIDYVKQSDEAEIIFGGNYNKSIGYYIEPTLVLTTNPMYRTMVEEIFGPVVTIYVYDSEKYEETLDLVDKTSEYSLTGSIFAKGRYEIDIAMKILENSAGNFYINDKPTGSVVGQQPFGGARGSGTNDKAGSILNLYRWISARTIKETFVTPTDYKYPFLEEDR